MPALVAGIHVLADAKNVDGRDKPGHDGPLQAIRFAPDPDYIGRGAKGTRPRGRRPSPPLCDSGRFAR
jgi:hypothetical protein